MEPALSAFGPPPPVCPWGELSENSRQGFRLAGSTLHQGPQPFKYLNGVGDTTSVVWNAWPESLKAQQQNGTGSSLPSALAMQTGSSIGRIFSGVKKFFGYGKDAKIVLDAKEQYSHWSFIHKYDLRRLQRDMGSSKYADPMHIGVDNAQLKFDEAEMGYYGAKMALTAGVSTGEIIFPQLGEGVLSQLEMQVNRARQDLADQNAAYNSAVGAVVIQNPN